MSTSLPSHEIYSVDVPAATNFTSEFQYNFFTPDEMVAETSKLANRFLTRPSEQFDSDLIQFMTSRVPRFVVLKWTTSIAAGVAKQTTDTDAKNHTHSLLKSSTLIHDNFSKIVGEDAFASQNFVGIHLQDAELDDKIYEFVSGSFVQRSLNDTDQQGSHYRSAMYLNANTPSDVTPGFLSKAMTQFESSVGTNFFKDSVNTLSVAILDEYLAKLKDVVASVQVNNKLLHDVIDRTVKDAGSNLTTDLFSLHKQSKADQRGARLHFNSGISAQDYKSYVPYVGLQAIKSFRTRTSVEIVGYVIDKFEMLPNGTVRNYDPIIIDNPRIGLTVDLRVRYGAIYGYTIRSIASYLMPMINDETNEVQMAQVLVSSRPSPVAYMNCTERVAPPPASDLNFIWNYELDKPLIFWTFPPNSQRDIKKFQLFRRTSIKFPFELIKMWDFDDSFVKTPDRESPDLALIQYTNDPISFYIDDEFTRESKFIYTVACIDAHGFTSNYSSQFELSFDKFKNKLVKKLISHAGAPKPYPNLYLDADAFVDTIKDSGHTQMKLYFNPEYYYLYDDQGRLTPAIATQQDGGNYKFSFINLDSQKQQIVNVGIDSRLTNKPQ